MTPSSAELFGLAKRPDKPRNSVLARMLAVKDDAAPQVALSTLQYDVVHHALCNADHALQVIWAPAAAG